MLCNNEWFTYAFQKFVGTPCNLVNYPDNDPDSGGNI